MDSQSLMKLGIAAGILYAVYKFAPNNAVKAAAVGVAGTIVAARVPYLRDALAA